MATKKGPKGRTTRKTARAATKRTTKSSKTAKTAKRPARTARRTATPKRTAAPKRTATTKRSTATKRSAATKRTTARRTAARRTTTPRPPRIRPGLVTHTELTSADPAATKRWCEKVLGWEFGEPVPTPGGPYHMWRFGNNTGGGIRANNPPETPGSIPYCEVPDIHAWHRRALDAGAKEMMPPTALPNGMGWVAVVMAPGGPAVGFWGLK